MHCIFYKNVNKVAPFAIKNGGFQILRCNDVIIHDAIIITPLYNTYT